MAKIIIDNDTLEILRNEDGTMTVDQDTFNYDLIKVGANDYHLLLNDISYRIERLERSGTTGELQIKINGRVFSGKLSYKIEELLKTMGMSTAKRIQKEIKAPMPGLVLDILVQEGSEVQEGDDLVILEAMKMENALKAPQSGVIASVNVKKQDKVDKNEILVSYQ